MEITRIKKLLCFGDVPRVAELANVSIKTVSSYVNNNKAVRISEKTKIKIINAIDAVVNENKEAGDKLKRLLLEAESAGVKETNAA